MDAERVRSPSCSPSCVAALFSSLPSIRLKSQLKYAPSLLLLWSPGQNKTTPVFMFRCAQRRRMRPQGRTKSIHFTAYCKDSTSLAWRNRYVPLRLTRVCPFEESDLTSGLWALPATTLPKRVMQSPFGESDGKMYIFTFPCTSRFDFSRGTDVQYKKRGHDSSMGSRGDVVRRAIRYSSVFSLHLKRGACKTRTLTLHPFLLFNSR